MSKTVDEAVNIALEELGVNKEDVHVEVLEEPSKGLFGLLGTRDATVKVTVTNDPVERDSKIFKFNYLYLWIIKGRSYCREK